MILKFTLARHAGRDDHDVRPGRLLPSLIRCADAGHTRVRFLDRTRLEHVERHALGFLLRDVDDHDIGKLLVGDRPRNSRADVAGASNHGHFPIHDSTPRL
jgi:hypothetical protein